MSLYLLLLIRLIDYQMWMRREVVMYAILRGLRFAGVDVLFYYFVIMAPINIFVWNYGAIGKRNFGVLIKDELWFFYACFT